MRLYAVRIFVHDLAAARPFYEHQLGLEILWESPTAVGYDVGPTLILEQSDELVGRFVAFSLQIEDIHGTCARLSAAGVVFLGPPEEQPWGGHLAHLRDPEGNVLTLVEP